MTMLKLVSVLALHRLIAPASALSLKRNASIAVEGKPFCTGLGNLPPSNCYTTPWLQELHAVDPAPEKVFVDVGCNTGTEAAQWLDTWEMTGLVEKWRQSLLNRVPGGACGQNIPRNPSLASNFQKPTLAKGKVLCIEAMLGNANLLNSVNAAIFGQSSPVEVIHVAASDQSGTINFPDNNTGVETRGINNFVVVPMTTVDKIVTERGISRVDVLTVDTEGHDPAVLRGALQTLHRVRFLQFEVHEDFTSTEWGKTTMLSVLNDLDGAGFDCYWPGNDGSLRKLTGCWNQHLQASASPIGWSNVVCSKRGDVWHAVLARHAI